jgi:Fe-S-cluster-containing dehydrogenase component
LRAVGYLDVLRIPTRIVEEHILPHIPKKQLPALLPTEAPASNPDQERRMEVRPETIETGMLEFLVEQRYINGTQAMMIDLDRCTRCDDCVRACASTHDGNPRFVREGMRHEQYLIANACMHCADPVCMIGCPTGAISRNMTDGIVAINDNTCIGCSTCANSCPYGNIRMVEVRDPKGRPFVDREKNLPIVKATKCDLCIEQIGGPACQRACPHDAMIRIDLTTADQIKTFLHD